VNQVPVIYEIQTDTPNADGAVHRFCSVKCRMQKQNEVFKDVNKRGFFARCGFDPIQDAPQDARCEGCNQPIAQAA
jgi:hypothetical protein